MNKINCISSASFLNCTVLLNENNSKLKNNKKTERKKLPRDLRRHCEAVTNKPWIKKAAHSSILIERLEAK